MQKDIGEGITVQRRQSICLARSINGDALDAVLAKAEGNPRTVVSHISILR